MKQVHWQLPFESLDGNDYRIDIYDDPADGNGGTITTDGWPIQLVGGAEPFTTDEDNSDDFFAPVRSQTGMIHIVNTDGLVTYDDMMPRNYTDKPVQVVNVGTGDVVWQGFLAPQTYTQQYVSRPNTVDLVVNGMLETLSNIRIDVQPTRGHQTLRQWIRQAITTQWWDNVQLRVQEHIHVSVQDWYKSSEMNISILDGAYVSAEQFFSIEEKSVGDGKIEQAVEGAMAADVLSAICRYLGMVCREQGNTIYIMPCGIHHNQQQKQITDMEWRASDHTISISAPAKSVKVSCQMDDAKLNIDMPSVPLVPMLVTTDYTQYASLRGLVQQRNDNYTNVILRQGTTPLSWSLQTEPPALPTMLPTTHHVLSVGNTTETAWADPKERILYGVRNGANDMLAHQNGNYLSTACWAKIRKGIGGAAPQFDEGIFMQMIPMPNGLRTTGGISLLTLVDPIRKKLSIRPFWQEETRRVYVKVEIAAKAYGNLKDPQQTFGGFVAMDEQIKNISIPVALKYGDMQLFNVNGSILKFDDGGNIQAMFELPYPTGQEQWEQVGGGLSLTIGNYMYIDNWDDKYADDWTGVPDALLITSVKAELYYDVDFLSRSSGENIYYDDVYGAIGGEDIEVEMEIGSDMNNRIAKQRLQSRWCGPISESKCFYSNGTELIDATVQPMEVLVRDMMTNYYKRAHKRIELKVKHECSEPTAMLLINGYHGEKLMPMSESIEWKTGKSTLMCFDADEMHEGMFGYLPPDTVVCPDYDGPDGE